MRWRASRGRPETVLSSRRRGGTAESPITLCPTLDRVAKGGVAFAGSARSDPRVWYGRPDGAGEAALPHRPIRGCHGTRGSTLTSWRRGRMRGGSHRGGPHRATLSGAEDGASGGCWRYGSLGRVGCRVRITLARPQQSKQARFVRGHHMQRRTLSGVLGSFGSPDAQASRRFGVNCDASASYWWRV
jgi:hypothetical protein